MRNCRECKIHLEKAPTLEFGGHRYAGRLAQKQKLRGTKLVHQLTMASVRVEERPTPFVVRLTGDDSVHAKTVDLVVTCEERGMLMAAVRLFRKPDLLRALQDVDEETEERGRDV